MDLLEEPELTNRINTFMARKMQQYPDLAKKSRFLPKKPLARPQSYEPTFLIKFSSVLEKLNEVWVQRVHA